jgi:hypothetical protein
MKEVKMYKCELCNGVYDLKEYAFDCEAKGKEKPLAKVGDMIEYEVRVGGGFDPFYVEMRVSKIEDKGHFLIYYFEEYDEEDKEWYESGYGTEIGVWGNDDFKERCKVIS